MRSQFPLCRACPEGEINLEFLGSRICGDQYQIDLKCRRCGRFWLADAVPADRDMLTQNEQGSSIVDHDWHLFNFRPLSSKGPAP